jgi:hypothetical protein
MMVLFQNRIIYLPSLPPNAGRETIARMEGRNAQIWGWDENQSLLGKCQDWHGRFVGAVRIIFYIFRAISPFLCLFLWYLIFG